MLTSANLIRYKQSTLNRALKITLQKMGCANGLRSTTMATTGTSSTGTSSCPTCRISHRCLLTRSTTTTLRTTATTWRTTHSPAPTGTSLIPSQLITSQWVLTTTEQENIFTDFISGSITVLPDLLFDWLDSIKEVNLLFIQHKQSSRIQTS